MAEHEHDSQDDGLVHVAFERHFEGAVLLHGSDKVDILHHNANTNNKDQQIDPSPKSLQVAHSHHFEHEVVDSGLDEHEYQVEDEA